MEKTDQTQETIIFYVILHNRFVTHAFMPCLRRPARRTSSLAGESGFAQAGETRHFGVQARTIKIGQVLGYGNGYEASLVYSQRVTSSS